MTDFIITEVEHGLTGRLGAGERFSGALRVKDGRIAEMGDLVPVPGERVISARGAVVCPGFVNTHHHLFQSVLKAVPEGMDAGLDPWLMRVPFAWWPYLDEASFRVSATIGMAELALSGVTTVCDHHYIYSPQWDFDPVEILFEIAAKFGMRFVLARGGGTLGRSFSDPTIPPVPVETLEVLFNSVEAAAARFHDPAPFSMTRIALAPTTPTFNVAPETLPVIADVARGLGLRLHSHLSENPAYAAFTLAKYGKRPVHWLADLDWLGPDVWFAHLVDCDASEVAALAESGTAMAHCPQANARLGSGIAPADALQALGGTVSLGVDGAGANEAADMGSALYSAFVLHRATKGPGAARAETVLHWATAGGAKALGFDKIGTLAPGMAADIAILNLTAPRYLGQHDPAIGPIISGGSLDLRASFVAGRMVAIDNHFCWLDLQDLAEEARSTVAALIARKQRGTAPVARARAAQT